MTEPAENQDTKTVAFFDFDGTLTTGDTLMPFLKFVVGAPRYYTKLAFVSPVLMAYFAKLIRNDVAKQIVLKQYLAGYHIDELFELGQRFSEEVIPTMLRPEGMERLRWHQEHGHECVLVSASLDIYLRAWAKETKFVGVLCTSLETQRDNCTTGQIRGANCHGQEKVERIYRWQTGRNLSETYAYGDTSGDIPMIQLVQHGYVWQRRAKNFVSI